MALHPFQTTVEIQLTNGMGGQNGSVQVPANRRLVLEYASGEGFQPVQGNCEFMR